MLHVPVVDTTHKTYCGPMAVAALTGVPVSRIEKMIRRVRSENRRKYYGTAAGKYAPAKKIVGTGATEIVKVLRRLGCKVDEMKKPEPTMARFGVDTLHMRGAFLVNVPGHWIAVSGGMMCDTRDGPRAIADYAKPLRRVSYAFHVLAPATPKVAEPAPMPAPRPAKPKEDIKAVRARKLAAQIAAWEAKERRAVNALKKLRPKLRRYERAGIVAESR